MPVRSDCRHYSTRSIPGGDAVQRCRLGANDEAPFGCPADCLFFEPRSITATGWETPPPPAGGPATGEADPPPS